MENRYEEKLKELVSLQANDKALWSIAETAHEAYLQQELRRLHYAVEYPKDIDAFIETYKEILEFRG